MSAAHLVALHTNLVERLRKYDSASAAAAAMTAITVQVVDGADYVGLTRVSRGGKLVSLGATDPLVEQVDQVQYELGSGPCVDVTVSDRPFATDDLANSTQWPEFSRRAVELGVQSMLSYRLYLEDDQDDDGERVLGGLNLYSRKRDAFDLQQALPVLSVLATYAALALWGATVSEHAASIERALSTSRDIGAAQGILIERFKITREDAFGLLSTVSQASNRKLRDVATELVDTGALALPARPRGRRTN